MAPTCYQDFNGALQIYVHMVYHKCELLHTYSMTPLSCIDKVTIKLDVFGIYFGFLFQFFPSSACERLTEQNKNTGVDAYTCEEIRVIKHMQLQIYEYT